MRINSFWFYSFSIDNDSLYSLNSTVALCAVSHAISFKDSVSFRTKIVPSDHQWKATQMETCSFRLITPNKYVTKLYTIILFSVRFRFIVFAVSYLLRLIYHYFISATTGQISQWRYAHDKLIQSLVWNADCVANLGFRQNKYYKCTRTVIILIIYGA